jgi:DNA-binding transcriptional LysR family regulator
VLDWDDFRFLLAISREGTLSGAARALKVDQSTVSRRLSAIESAASAKLFDRTPEGYVLTPAGRAVLPSLEQIEGSAISVERKLLGHDARLEGRVRLATSDSFAAWFLVPRLERFRAEQPGIWVELFTGNQPVDLARREADLSLRLSKPEKPNLIARRVGRAAWAVYAASSYVENRGVPEPRQRLTGHDVIAFDQELRGTLGARWLREHGDLGSVVLCSNSLLTQAAAVTAGLGVSPLPCLFGDVRPDLVRLPFGTIGHHDIWLVMHPDVKTSARVRVLSDFLTALIQREAALLTGRQVRGAARFSARR